MSWYGLRPPRRRIAIAVSVGLTAFLIAACGSRLADPSAPYFPTSSAAGPPAASAGLSAVDPLSGAGIQLAKGGISRPNPRLTPGQVSQTDTHAVCSSPLHTKIKISYPEQEAVFARYGISLSQQRHYSMDYLVPLDIGGAPSLSNLWPAAVKGNGFHEKEQLNHQLRVLVCRGTLTLAAAQRGVVKDWFAMWASYSTAQ
ncbi:MAG TPA: hypothetical protein VFN75_03910 [Pseudonocardiaceae bacterium]|nr:hypothetical protein [Pseudonocardiaceae bacterium]